MSQQSPPHPGQKKNGVIRLHEQPILRSDFAMFDEYEYPKEQIPSFDTPILCFHAKHDKKITKPMVKR